MRVFILNILTSENPDLNPNNLKKKKKKKYQTMQLTYIDTKYRGPVVSCLMCDFTFLQGSSFLVDIAHLTFFDGLCPYKLKYFYGQQMIGVVRNFLPSPPPPYHGQFIVTWYVLLCRQITKKGKVKSCDNQTATKHSFGISPS